MKNSSRKPATKSKPRARRIRCDAWFGTDGRALQPIELDKSGVARFRANKIVQLLLDDGKYDMNRLALLPFSDSDRAQFAQLIGYSVCGFGELRYSARDQVAHADEVAASLVPNVDLKHGEDEK